jgi:T5SS/PEP-CTERM-associated repeat protein
VKTNYLTISGLIKIACLALLALALPNLARAQFTGDYQTNIISGTAVYWPSAYHIGSDNLGSNHVFDALFIPNGGSLTVTGFCFIGYQSNSHDNLALVSGSGSTWTNYKGDFYVGGYGPANQLVISDGGKVTSSGQASVGNQSSSISNSVLITGGGSVWKMAGGLFMGDGGAYCSMVISNAGAVYSQKGYVGGNNGGQSNIAIVTGIGSVWSNSTRMEVGDYGRGNRLVVSNGGAVLNIDGYVGLFARARSNSVLVTGQGSLWKNSGAIYVGLGGSSPASLPADGNSLTIVDAASVLASNVYLGFNQIASNSLLSVSGGNLTVTNLSGTGTIDVRRGRLTFNGGTITAERLWLTNGVDSILEFNSGTFHSKATVVSNAQPCMVGDAVGSGNFHLLGGIHSFQNGLRIRTNSFLSGCGTVNGSVVVDPGGAIHANCTNLVFASNVTNNGTMVADGAVLEALGTFVNNGKIYLLNGGTTNFHGQFINNGQILNSNTQLAIERDGSGGIFIRFTGAPDVSCRLQRAPSVNGPWSSIATYTAPASGSVEYHETTPPSGKSFYRTVQP